MSWFRHKPDPKFHAGTPVDGSRLLLCTGRWPLADEDRGEVEQAEQPPHDERCAACQRVRIDQIRIERGLDELEINARELGGEA